MEHPSGDVATLADTIRDSLNSLLGGPGAQQPREQASPYRRVHVVINPSAGQNRPILQTLNAVFGATGVDWDVSITRQAAAAGAGAVAAQERFPMGAEADAGAVYARAAGVAAPRVDHVVEHGADGHVRQGGGEFARVGEPHVGVEHHDLRGQEVEQVIVTRPREVLQLVEPFVQDFEHLLAQALEAVDLGGVYDREPRRQRPVGERAPRPRGEIVVEFRIVEARPEPAAFTYAR